MVFQSFNLFSHLTVMDNITLAQKVVRHRPKVEAEKVAFELLEKVGIEDKAEAYPMQLPEASNSGRHRPRSGNEP